MIHKGRINAPTENGIVTIHPETSVDQVIDTNTGEKLTDILKNVGSAVTSVQFLISATEDGQNRFEFNDPDFSEDDTVLVFVTGEFMHVNEEFTVDTTGELPAIVFSKGYPEGTRVYILVLHNIKSRVESQLQLLGEKLNEMQNTIDEQNQKINELENQLNNNQ